jgi:hypothetical protein
VNTYENRRENLRRLVEQWGGPKPLSNKLGYRTASFIVQMAGPHPTREVSERTARTIEQVLDLPRGWLDTTPGNSPVGQTVDMTLVSDSIRAVAQGAEEIGLRLTPARMADLVTLVYTDAETAGAVRAEFVSRVLNLLR